MRTVASGPSCSPRRRASPAISTWPRSASRTPTRPRSPPGPARASPVIPVRTGISGDALAGPGGERGRVGVLDALLGQVEIAGDARRRGEHEGPLATVRIVDRGGYRARRDAAPGVGAAPAPRAAGRGGTAHL